MKRHTALAFGFSLLIASAFSARAVLVQEVSITPSKVVPISVTGFYTGIVTAGINQLLVDGVAANGFCIDPFHFALGSSTGYAFTPLANAPKPPATMGAIKADQISRLWAMAYAPSMSAAQAAGFQIAIWQIVAGPMFSFSGSDYGASALLSNLASFSGPGAKLVGLTGPGQDYVIQDFRITAVPDTGTTLLLLAVGVGAIVAVNQRIRFARS